MRGASWLCAVVNPCILDRVSVLFWCSRLGGSFRALSFRRGVFGFCLNSSRARSTQPPINSSTSGSSRFRLEITIPKRTGPDASHTPLRNPHEAKLAAALLSHERADETLRCNDTGRLFSDVVVVSRGERSDPRASVPVRGGARTTTRASAQNKNRGKPSVKVTQHTHTQTSEYLRGL